MRLAILAAGSNVHTMRWVNSMAAQNCEVHLLTIHGIMESVLDTVQVELLRIPPPLGYLLNASQLRSNLTRIRPDLMHAHYATGYGTLAALSGFHPTILSVWGSDVFDFPHQSTLHRRLLEFNLARADKILSTSHVMAAETAKYTSKPIEVTPFGIDLEQFRPQPVNSLFDTDDIVIGTVKTLEKKYGMEYLLRAFTLLKHRYPEQPLKLLIVGGGTQEAYLRGLAQDLGIAVDTVFTGKVPHGETPSYQNMLDISVTLSNRESFGVAVLEASACAKPVVVSNVGGLPEVVEDGVTGLVVEPRDPQQTADAIERLLADPDLRKRMGKAGRERVRRLYDWDASVAQMLGIYRRMVS